MERWMDGWMDDRWVLVKFPAIPSKSSHLTATGPPPHPPSPSVSRGWLHTVGSPHPGVAIVITLIITCTPPALSFHGLLQQQAAAAGQPGKSFADRTARPSPLPPAPAPRAAQRRWTTRAARPG